MENSEEKQHIPVENIQRSEKTKLSANMPFLATVAGVIVILVGLVSYTLGAQTNKTVPITVKTTSVPTQAVEPTNTPLPTSDTTLKPTVSKAQSDSNTLTSALCPVKFTVSTKRIQSGSGYLTWQLKDRDGERFTYIPRAEENNGKSTEVELRGENQVEGNGETEVVVRCQDNNNKWSTEDLLAYVKKADEMSNTEAVQMNIWGRNVYRVSFTPTYSNQKNTVWVFATPSKLFAVQERFWTGNYVEPTDKIFNTLSFQ